MKILFLAVGKRHETEYAEAVNDFTERISHYAPVEWRFIPTEKTAEKEGESILKSVEEKDYVILLDERGKEADTLEFSDLLNKRLNSGTHRLVFIIGGAFGVSDAIRQRADLILALSKLTFPHQLVRVILAEQVYRAFSILRGEKYHHR